MEVYERIVAYLKDETQYNVSNNRLFDDAEIILPQYLVGTNDLWEKRRTLMRLLATDLADSRRKDHTNISALLIKLFDGWSWQQVCDFGTSSIPYQDGLEAGDHMIPFNKLMLNLLAKATTNATDAGQVAGMLDTVQALVRLWLCTNDTGIATEAERVLYDLMKASIPANYGQRLSWQPGPVGLPGWMWKRVFGDRDVYNVLFECCSLKSATTNMTKSQKTIAQARLMEWMPKVGALHWNAIGRSQNEAVEARYGVKGGLLEFAALHMVDHKDDLLMHVCLIDFYAELLKATAKVNTHTIPQYDSIGLQYLIMHGLHARTAAIYLQTGPVNAVDAMFLYGPAANYVSVYASEYPKHFLAGQMAQQVNDRLRQILDRSPGKWAHAESPKHDLHVLASLPRQSLLPFTSSPLALLPSKSTNPDVLNTLATIFHGPDHRHMTFSPQSAATSTAAQDHDAEEGAAARSLYYHYIANNPRCWQDLTKHADTVALKDLALSAVNHLAAVITANWSAKPDLPLPSSTIATPETGLLAILTPPALEYTLPYLLKPAPTFTNLVGGRGDSESAAFKIAAAKFEALKALNIRLMAQAERTPSEGYEEILGTIGKRLAKGPLDREGDVGGSIGTMDL